LALAEGDAPGLEQLEDALRTPARPLFIGRKACMPATPILIGRRTAPNLRGALAAEPLADIGPRRRPTHITACWPAEEGEGAQGLEMFDVRDWANNLHRGAMRYAVGILEITA
jgi:CRISPR system Cascade subunit CasD